MDFDFLPVKLGHTLGIRAGKLFRTGTLRAPDSPIALGEGQHTPTFNTPREWASESWCLESWPLDEILAAYHAVEGSGGFGSHRNSHVLDGFTWRPSFY